MRVCNRLREFGRGRQKCLNMPKNAAQAMFELRKTRMSAVKLADIFDCPDDFSDILTG